MATALHVQQQIIDAVQALLAGGGTAAGSNVYADRVSAIPEGLLPAITVEEAPRGESVDQATISGLQERTYEVLVTCTVKAVEGYAAAARALGLEVEKLMAASPALRALAKGGVRIVASDLDRDGAGSRPMAARRQVWRFTYFVRSTAPDVVA